MKQIIEYFGGTILAVLAAGCVMGLFSGLPGNLGRLAESTLVMEQPELGETQAFVEHQSTPERRIMVKENYAIQTGITYEVEDFFTISDSAGTDYEVWFVLGWHESLPEVKMQVQENGKLFSCTHPGVYQVILGYDSPDMGICETQVRLVVNGEVVA